MLKPLLEILAGVPTVVYGFFALTFVTPNILQKLPGLGGIGKINIYNALSAGLVVGFMVNAPVASSNTDRLIKCSPIRPRSGPRITSRVGSVRVRHTLDDALTTTP